jgi:Ribonuclease G/E
MGLINKAGAFFSYGDTRLGQGRESAKQYLRGNPDLAKEIEEKIKKAKEPGLLYQDLPIATSVIRDLFTADVTRVVIDSKKLFKDIRIEEILKEIKEGR